MTADAGLQEDSGMARQASVLAERLPAWAPPIRRREFWVVQALVLLIAGGHSLLEFASRLDLGPIEFVPVSLFLLPVMYSALSFGLRGSAPTAIWCVLLSIPNLLVWHTGSEQLGELWQAGLVVAVGFYAGERADRERRLREEAERRERERQVSEQKYRGLFEAAADATMLLDPQGRILEANAASASLLGMSQDAMRGERFADLAPRELAAALRAPDGRRAGPIGINADGRTIWIDPLRLELEKGSSARRLVQLRDVTPQVERQQLLESYTSQTTMAREEERRQVARELHDGPLQSLMLLWQKLDQLDRATSQDGTVVEDARRTAQAVADELRRFSRDLRPSVLDDLGLGPALRAEAAAFQQRTGIHVRFVHSGSRGRLAPEVELALLRISQEALRNVDRHAQAQRVTVRLTVSARSVRLAVSDDGQGLRALSSAAVRVAAGKLGIVGMQERARLVGGSLNVRSASRGTLVEVLVPI